MKGKLRWDVVNCALEEHTIYGHLNHLIGDYYDYFVFLVFGYRINRFICEIVSVKQLFDYGNSYERIIF